MNERAQEGLIDKFRVQRTDGRDAVGERHHGCRYFVLDLDHDAFAIPAIESYANACVEVYPVLARELRSIAAKARWRGLAQEGGAK